MTEIAVAPIKDDLGAYVNIAPEHILDEGIPEKCLALLNEFGVLVFPQIALDDQTQVAFSSRMGKMAASKFAKAGASVADDLGIYPVTLDPSRAKHLDYVQSNEHWHMDGTTYKTPPKATNLKCVVPPSSGGDTEFVNLFAAYEALPADKKAQIADLRVVHSAESASIRYFSNPSDEDRQRWHRDGPPTEQPLVWRQADGRCSMVIGSTAAHIVGMEPGASKTLLDELLEWSTQPRFCYRHQWQQGDMVIWNNPGLLHRAHRYTADSGRLMHRTTIMGTESFS
jgi:alpha-ketoglutarate-dependent taurine dioxygenase